MQPEGFHTRLPTVLVTTDKNKNNVRNHIKPQLEILVSEGVFEISTTC